MARNSKPLPGNPWWSEPGRTLDRFEKDGSSEATGRHAGRNIAEAAAPRHAGQEPKHRAESHSRTSAPVQKAARQSSLADRATATDWSSYERLVASLRKTGQAGKAHFAAALRRLVATFRSMAR